jgi:hypothetical protein
VFRTSRARFRVLACCHLQATDTSEVARALSYKWRLETYSKPSSFGTGVHSLHLREIVSPSTVFVRSNMSHRLSTVHTPPSAHDSTGLAGRTTRRTTNAVLPASRLGSIIAVGDVSLNDAHRYFTCQGLTNASVINAAITVTGTRLIMMAMTSSDIMSAHHDGLTVEGAPPPPPLTHAYTHLPTHPTPPTTHHPLTQAARTSPRRRFLMISLASYFRLRSTTKIRIVDHEQQANSAAVVQCQPRHCLE